MQPVRGSDDLENNRRRRRYRVLSEAAVATLAPFRLAAPPVTLVSSRAWSACRCTIVLEVEPTKVHVLWLHLQGSETGFWWAGFIFIHIPPHGISPSFLSQPIPHFSSLTTSSLQQLTIQHYRPSCKASNGYSPPSKGIGRVRTSTSSTRHPSQVSIPSVLLPVFRVSLTFVIDPFSRRHGLNSHTDTRLCSTQRKHIRRRASHRRCL